MKTFNIKEGKKVSLLELDSYCTFVYFKLFETKAFNR